MVPAVSIEGQVRGRPRTGGVTRRVLQALAILASLAAFRAAQVRWQPDSLATAVPGLLSRLLQRPIDGTLALVVLHAHGLVALQIGALAAIFVTTFGAARIGAAAFGRGPQTCRVAARRDVLPRRREQAWN